MFLTLLCQSDLVKQIWEFISDLNQIYIVSFTFTDGIFTNSIFTDGIFTDGILTDGTAVLG